MTISHDDRQILQAARRIQSRERKERRSKVKAQNTKPTRGREIDRGFLAFLRRQPCAVAHMGGCKGPVQAAHIRFSDIRSGSVNPGMGRKNHDRHSNPLCENHHLNDQHKRNERAFWFAAGVDPYANAKRLYALYRTPQSEGSEK